MDPVSQGEQNSTQIPAGQPKKPTKIVKVGVLILVALLVGLGVGYWSGKNTTFPLPQTSQQTAQAPTLLPSPTLPLSNSPTFSPSLYAGWKTYVSSGAGGLTFKYPPYWKPSITIAPDTTERVTIVSPNQNFTVFYGYEPNDAGIGGSCTNANGDVDWALCNILGATSLDVPNFKKLTLAGYSSSGPSEEELIGVTDVNLPPGDSQFFLAAGFRFRVKDPDPHKGQVVTFEGSFNKSDSSVPTKRTDFENAPEVKTARMIFSSLSY